MDNTSLSLIASVSNLQKDFIVIFENDKVIFTNDSFNNFFNVSSTEHYNENFGDFVNNFVPHPSYFNKDKVTSGDHWIDVIFKLDKNDRVVSMLSQTYEPHAFSVSIDKSVNGYSVVVFKDITQDLIKRIMIQNNANIDQHSGAYAKEYFKQIAKTYHEAARFNEKVVAILSIVVTKEDVDHKNFVDDLVVMIRQDDMLVRWGDNRFLLVYMVDEVQNAHKVLYKFENALSAEHIKDYGCKLKLDIHDDKDEKITTFIKRI
ncbi:hypothetical protein [Sulfurimonas sp.]|uniref:hypothetical protein n=1 Tax=Sulfurimonas sp. TaxID=2022749 RepID=UPI0035645208